MKIEVYIEKKLKRTWIQSDNIFFTGCFFLSDRFLTENEVLEVLSKIKTFDDCKSLLDELNGFFSFIIKTADKVFVAVDRVRSIPLFYSMRNSELYVSNDAEYIRSITADIALDPIAVQEFCSYQVTGCDTLFQSIKQVQAGEMVEFDLTDFRCINMHNSKYFIFTHSEKYTEADRYMLESRMLSIFSESIDRLINYANGRQLVLPLSAGYDSRLIALMLYKKGVKNVLCFSYGIKGNFESVISKQVADILGFQWEFVEYTKELWYSWYNSNECLKYLRFASGWASLPHIQDFPAVYMLKKEKKILDDSIFIPGHVGDSLAGSDVPIVVNTCSQFSLSRFINNLLICYYYNLMELPKNILDKKIKNKRAIVKNRIIKELGIAESAFSSEDYADFYERWNWQECNPKFIINSVRVYEFWGYDWYLPFVDKNFMDYWKDVPLCLRYSKQMYNSVVDRLFYDLTGVRPPHHNKNIPAKSILRSIKSRILYTGLHTVYLLILEKIRFVKYIQNDTNAILGAFDGVFLKRYTAHLKNINFLFSISFLDKINCIINIEI